MFILNSHVSPEFFKTNTVQFWFHYHLEYAATTNANFQKIPIVNEDQPDSLVYEAIAWGFDKIKIPMFWQRDDMMVGPDEFEIFIPLKNQ